MSGIPFHYIHSTFCDYACRCKKIPFMPSLSIVASLLIETVFLFCVCGVEVNLKDIYTKLINNAVGCHSTVMICPCMCVPFLKID